MNIEKVIVDKLNWFPLSLAKLKRKQIKEIIESLNQPKNAKASEYRKEREKIFKISLSDLSEYPPWDKASFEKFLKSRNYDSNIEDEEIDLHSQKLKYYYNPDGL